MSRCTNGIPARLGVLLAVVVAITVALPGVSAAGGPTSVLLASPSGDAAAGLYYSDPDYDKLSALLGDVTAESPAVSTVPPAAAANAPYVTATWLIHDVSVWRIDRIFVVRSDEVWIVSESSWDSPLTGEGMFPGETGNDNAVWHPAADSVALAALLAGLGLTGGSSGSVGDLVSADALDAAPLQAIAEPVSASPMTSDTAGWFWGIGGLLAGLLVGGAGCWLLLARRGRDDAPADGTPARMVPIG